MKNSFFTLFAVLGLLSTIHTTEARVRDTRPTVAEQERNKKPTQQERIDNGFKSGRLTKAEYERLNAEQKLIREYREQVKQGGVSEDERAALDRIRDEQNKDIYNEKHDNQGNTNKLSKSLSGRIREGSRSGQLTRDERLELKDSQAEINEFQNAAEADGVVDWKEKAELVRLLQGQGQKIYDEKHDDQVKQYRQGSLDDLSGGNVGYVNSDAVLNDDYSNLTPDEIAELKTLRAKQRERSGSSGRARQEARSNDRIVDSHN